MEQISFTSLRGGIQMSNEIVHYAFNLVPVVWVIVALVEQADP